MGWLRWVLGLALFVGGAVLMGTVSVPLGIAVFVVGGLLMLSTRLGGAGAAAGD